ncbi:hypothetical protein MXL46_16890 [Heyndrickxia sporothermodurans]|uniref:hypothetical protein n=1 Tax=Heyndrickxia sporothermodurans TaxID=46224 RepID=UPI002DBF4182|nr:hypothetical protein [Heyndrickxia sporothermodurans]MEB6550744.1 hypothetical protein [Heyndrickxia sporothermodurans]
MLKNKYTFTGFLTIWSILLCACSGNKEEIKIDKKNSLSTIFIQKVEGKSYCNFFMVFTFSFECNF